MIAILGASGAGKSTILETLGLMNKTFVNGSHIVFNDDNGQEFPFDGMWNKKNGKDLEIIRNKHFSFIFQETNLMQNFTAYENVCLSQMLQGTSLSEATAQASDQMNNIGLSEIDHAKKANELSGGQKQRLAFVRAITPKYTVLFGDEPTGNLDEKTSEDLLSILKDDVINKGVSVIIVTHNIKLSVRFADLIMVITKSGKIGKLESKNIFTLEKTPSGSLLWKDYLGAELNGIEKRVRGLL
jgi:ABC-type lipoprotein export system ATPase subunit